jgi:hypothetical protein
VSGAGGLANVGGFSPSRRCGRRCGRRPALWSSQGCFLSSQGCLQGRHRACPRTSQAGDRGGDRPKRGCRESGVHRGRPARRPTRAARGRVEKDGPHAAGGSPADRARIPYQPEPGFGGCFRQMSGKVRTSRPHGWPVAPGPGRTWIREHWFPWGTWGWSRALHRAGVMVVHERQGDGVSGNDTPFAMEKTTSGRSCVVSRGIAGGFSGIVYVG